MDVESDTIIQGREATRKDDKSTNKSRKVVFTRKRKQKCVHFTREKSRGAGEKGKDDKPMKFSKVVGTISKKKTVSVHIN